MGIFGTSSPFDQDVDKATSENNTSEEWGLIMDICDRAGASQTSARDCLRAVMRRLGHADPHVQVLAGTLLDACVANCGRAFLLEVASRDFEADFRRILARSQPPVAARLRALLRKWADGEFKSDPQLDLIPSLHTKLRAELGESNAPAPTTASSTASASASASAALSREQDELARAIALSLRDSAPALAAASEAPLYPRVDAAHTPAPVQRTVRALYDFEAAEDNELTFSAGDIIHVTESSDPNWWKGQSERGEGLFPANFVTFDLEPAPASASASSGRGRSVQFAEETEEREREEATAAVISESEMDAALAALHEADPEAGEGIEGRDAAEGRVREARVAAMGPLVDDALQRADTRHARLTHLSAELVAALNMYHNLMRDHAPPAHPASRAQHPQHLHPPRC